MPGLYTEKICIQLKCKGILTFVTVLFRMNKYKNHIERIFQQISVSNLASESDYIMCCRMTGILEIAMHEFTTICNCKNFHAWKFVILLGRSKGEKFFGFSFIKLVNEDGTVLKDDEYELFLYKVSTFTLSIIQKVNAKMQQGLLVYKICYLSLSRGRCHLQLPITRIN